MSETRFNQTVALCKFFFFISQNMDTLQNCSLKKCILKLPPQTRKYFDGLG